MENENVQPSTQDRVKSFLGEVFTRKVCVEAGQMCVLVGSVVLTVGIIAKLTR